MCRCCEAIKELQDIEKTQEKALGIQHILRARLTSITRKKGIKREIGVVNFDSYDLNYCPICGRRLGE